MEVYNSATFSEGISLECHSSSRSSTDREIEGKRERWEWFHLKHPLMNCSRIQLSLSSVDPPSLSLSTKPVAGSQCAQLCVHVEVCMYVLKRWRGTERLCQKAMVIAAVVSEHVAWTFCIASMHLFDGSACFIRISTHIRFHGLSYCCSVGKF